MGSRTHLRSFSTRARRFLAELCFQRPDRGERTPASLSACAKADGEIFASGVSFAFCDPTKPASSRANASALAWFAELPLFPLSAEGFFRVAAVLSPFLIAFSRLTRTVTARFIKLFRISNDSDRQWSFRRTSQISTRMESRAFTHPTIFSAGVRDSDSEISAMTSEHLSSPARRSAVRNSKLSVKAVSVLVVVLKGVGARR